MEETKEIDQTIEIKNPNDLWGHAISLEPIRKELDIKAEAELMRDLFSNHLPSDPANRSAIESYFDRLQEAIENGEKIEYDGFEGDDDPNTFYKYFSADILKERSSRHALLPDGEGVADPPYSGDPWSPTSSQHSESADVSLLPVSENPEGSQDNGSR